MNKLFGDGEMVRCFPGALSFGKSNNMLYGISAFFKYNFCLASRWKINCPDEFFFIFPRCNL